MPIQELLKETQNIFRKEYVPINLGIIQKLINEKYLLIKH